MKNQARSWQIRCPQCDRTRDAREPGILRVGAASWGKRILGWCTVCRRPRLLVVERKPGVETAVEG